MIMCLLCDYLQSPHHHFFHGHFLHLQIPLTRKKTQFLQTPKCFIYNYWSSILWKKIYIINVEEFAAVAAKN